MKHHQPGVRDIFVGALAAVCILTVCMSLPGCQKGESTSGDEIAGLLKEMKAWFEATDYEASGYSSLEEALNDIYQDEGYTASLYADVDAVLNRPGSGDTTPEAVLKECQVWFELIDYEMSGYESLDEAIEDIYPDGGATLDLYRRIAEHNARSK
jgi:hypothetical protein